MRRQRIKPASFNRSFRSSIISLAPGAGTRPLSRADTAILVVSAFDFSRCACRPFISGQKPAEQGGLLAYGPRFTQVYRQRGRMVAKVLRGTKPADILVEQPTNFELVVNTKAAEAIEYKVPAGLMLRADEVIE